VKEGNPKLLTSMGKGGKQERTVQKTLGGGGGGGVKNGKNMPAPLSGDVAGLMFSPQEV